jgi:hypothetical protein
MDISVFRRYLWKRFKGKEKVKPQEMGKKEKNGKKISESISLVIEKEEMEMWEGVKFIVL